MTFFMQAAQRKKHPNAILVACGRNQSPNNSSSLYFCPTHKKGLEFPNSGFTSYAE
jgi:hypothetical protein